MKWIAYLLGFSYITICSFLILYTRETVNWLKGLFQSYQLKYLSAIPAVVGLLLLISASATTFPWIFRVTGLLAIGEAAVAFTNPRNIYTRMLDWYLGDISDQTHRLFGIIGIIFGTAILSWVK